VEGDENGREVQEDEIGRRGTEGEGKRMERAP